MVMSSVDSHTQVLSSFHLQYFLLWSVRSHQGATFTLFPGCIHVAARVSLGCYILHLPLSLALLLAAGVRPSSVSDITLHPLSPLIMKLSLRLR